MTVWAYIDGFNLYYGAIREAERRGLGSFRWLDPVALVRKLAPGDTVPRVKYFTALVTPLPTDPAQQARQLVYWKALRTLPEIEITEGRFQHGRRSMPTWTSAVEAQRLVAQGLTPHLRRVEVWRSEEKGSDVNLATHLVHDAHLSRFDKALVISNDSDLREAIRVVVREVGRPVVVCNPSPWADMARDLSQVATERRRLRVGALAACQLPDPTADPASGERIAKPKEW